MIKPVTQTKYNQGAAMMIFMIFFMVASIALTFSISRAVYAQLQQFRLLYDSKQSYLAADGAIEDMAYRFIAGIPPDATEVIAIGGATATSTRTFDSVNDVYTIVSTGVDNGAHRKSSLRLFIGGGASFNFGLQSGNGGIVMENSSSVIGNVFGNGPIEGKNNNFVYGDVISAGPTGSVEGIHATGSVWANHIEDTIVDLDAYFVTESANVVYGTRYSPEPDQATATMPITDAQIDDWKAEAEAGGVIASTDTECSGGTYTIDSDTTIGPVKIECNLFVDKNSTDVYLQGPVWVEGNFTTKSSPDFHVDASVTGKTIQIIADNPSNRLTSSKMILQNTATFSGHGVNSHILLISQNDSAENGGSGVAIHLQNSATGDILLYAAHGEVRLENSANLKEVTGHTIRLQNSAQVVYESGLVNLLFTSGPGGGYTFGPWTEVE